MPDSPAPAYKVDNVPAAVQQVQTLYERAKRKGVLVLYSDALVSIREKLQTSPHEWGDPEYHTIKEGGTVHRGIQAPLFAKYVVYEQEKSVLLLEICGMPGQILEQDH